MSQIVQKGFQVTPGYRKNLLLQHDHRSLVKYIQSRPNSSSNVKL